MKYIKLVEYGPIISSKTIGNEIYKKVIKLLDRNTNIIVDLTGIKSMATFCAKQIFGRLYLELGSEAFFDRILLKGADDDLKTIIQIGIQNAIEKNQ